ncbi:MAG: hypothetical protein MN733_41260 [Nitrososphaera sp.]|nr:hypothetical protein [Nitrososphaera sp.]
MVVDVSGRLEKTDRENVAVAFSNGIEAAIFIPGKIKLMVNETFRRQGIPRKKLGVRLLVAGLYLLLEDFLSLVNQITIDDELPGWGNEIKRELLSLIHRRIPDFDKSKIEIRPIGEHTKADQRAYLVRKRMLKPYKKITLYQLVKVVRQIQ